MSPKALLLIAHGTEEMEFTITYDTLVRGGIECVSAYVGPTTQAADGAAPLVVCSRGMKIQADQILDPSVSGPTKYDLLVIPGGAEGAHTISQSKAVQDLIRDYIHHEALVAMICAGSLAALTSGLPKQPLTSHPSVQAQLEEKFEYSEKSVVESGHLITSRGPGTAFPFALKLVERLCGAGKSAEVKAPMMFPGTIPM